MKPALLCVLLAGCATTAGTNTRAEGRAAIQREYQMCSASAAFRQNPFDGLRCLQRAAAECRNAELETSCYDDIGGYRSGVGR